MPKGAVYTHGIFAAQVDMLRRLYGIEPGEIDLQTFPLFGLFAPALGMTAIVPDMDATRPAQVDPRKIIEAIEDFGVTNLFGSPALLNRVGRFGVEHNVKLPSLQARPLGRCSGVGRASSNASRPCSSPASRSSRRTAPPKSLPVCSIGSDEILTADSVHDRPREPASASAGRWQRCSVQDHPHQRRAIPVWSDDLLVPPGQIGEIVVQGPVVTREYYQPARIDGPGENCGRRLGFYHRMGDLGYLDEQGRLWFCGRKSHRVVTAQRNAVHHSVRGGVQHASEGLSHGPGRRRRAADG